jgi:outer membrane protein OmpA-like peptidoglycan-associated protein
MSIKSEADWSALFPDFFIYKTNSISMKKIRKTSFLSILIMLWMLSISLYSQNTKGLLPAGESETSRWEILIVNQTGKWTGYIEYTMTKTGYTGKIFFDQHRQLEEINKIELIGNSIKFYRPIGNQYYQGTINGNSITGTFTWQGNVSNWSAKKAGYFSNLHQVKPIRVTASSVYPADRSTYYPEHTIDNDAATAWFPKRTDKTNQGQWLKFEFEQAVKLDSVAIVNGWVKSDQLWSYNSRVRQLLITFSNGSEQTINLSDVKTPQWFGLPEYETEWIQLTIIDSYTGNTLEAGITDVGFYEKGVSDQETEKLFKLNDPYFSGYKPYYLSLSPDGNYLYFMHDEKTGNGKEVSNLYRCRKGLSGWEKPELYEMWPGKNITFGRIMFNSTEDMAVFHQYLAKDISGSSSYEVMFSVFDGKQWSLPQNAGKSVNSAGNDYDPVLSPDGRFLVFSSSRNLNAGDSKLWVSESDENGTWKPAYNMGSQVNKGEINLSPYFATDSRTLFFTSTDDGVNYDIFYTVFDGNSWSERKKAGKDINTPGKEISFVIHPEGKRAWFISNRENGSSEIYEALFASSLTTSTMASVYGIINDPGTDSPVDARITARDIETSATYRTGRINPNTGRYRFYVPNGRKYSLTAEKDGYFFGSAFADLSAPGSTSVSLFAMSLSPVEAGAMVTMNNIFFETGKSRLSETSIAELQLLLMTLKKYPGMIIEISGHTDNTGTADANLSLSIDRANVVKNYLIENGINENRLRATGFGQSKPVSDNDSAEGRQRNRRTEFKVLSL